MKQITKYCSLIILLVVIFLGGCGFTDTSTGRIISSIERVEVDGVVKMIIKYEDELISLGLDIPFVHKLKRKLIDKGIVVNGDTLDELVEQLCK